MKGELPEGWELSTLDALGPIISGGTPKTKEPKNFDGEIPWVTPADLTGYTAKTISRGRRNISQRGLETSSARMMPKRSVLFSSRAPIGYVAIAANEISTNQGFKSVVVSSEADENYVYYYLKSAKHLAEQEASGTTFKEISGSRFAKLPIPVPPLDEQRRIVEKIETLFARLDKGEEAVREVQKLLKRYRQSVLKSAVTGELTADWRAERAGALESGADLLARILKAREENWQGRGKYKAPVAPDTTGLPDLPEGWVWASVDQLSSAVEYGSSAKCSDDASGVPVLRMGNILEGRLIFDSLKYLPRDHGEFPKLLLEKGDLLFNRTNSAELVGKTAVYEGNEEVCSFASYLIRVRLIEVAPELVSSYINSLFGREWVKSVVSQQVGQANVNGTKLKALAVPLPPLSEQQAIIERLTEVSSKIANLEHYSGTELKRSAALRQSILKEAFSGRLVPQDPNDEPASALLARIQRSKKKK